MTFNNKLKSIVEQKGYVTVLFKKISLCFNNTIVGN